MKINEAKRSSLVPIAIGIVNFCFKTKSKAKKKLKFLCSQNEENLVFQRAHDVIVMQWRSIFGFETQFDEKTKSNSFSPTLKGVNLIFKESFDSTRNQELTSEIFALRKIKISSIQIFQQAIPKNLHCLSGGNNFESMHTLYFRPSFGDFLRRNFNFLAKRSSLELFVTFCFKTKSKRNDLVKILNFFPPKSFFSPTLKRGSFLRKYGM